MFTNYGPCNFSKNLTKVAFQIALQCCVKLVLHCSLYHIATLANVVSNLINFGLYLYFPPSVLQTRTLLPAPYPPPSRPRVYPLKHLLLRIFPAPYFYFIFSVLLALFCLNGVELYGEGIKCTFGLSYPTGHKTCYERQMNVVFRSVRRKLLKNVLWT